MQKFYNDVIDNFIALRIVLAFIILVVIFCVNSVGYHFVEGMNFFDGFYMTFITITTIGFSELTNLSASGRVLTMFLFLMGIGVIAYIAFQTTQLIFESEIFRKRAMKKQLQKMNQHYIVTGYGRIGHRIAAVLQEADIPLVIVENRESSIEHVRDDQLLYVAGDAQDETILKEAGIERARGLICTLSRDQDNVFVTFIAREINQDIFILVRTNQHQNTKKIIRAGADKVISPYEIGADRMGNVILRPHVDQFRNRIQSGSSTNQVQDHVFDEVKVFEDSNFDGTTLAEAHISAGDSLIMLGDVERIKHLREEGCDDYRSLSERVSHHEFTEHLNSHQEQTNSV